MTALAGKLAVVTGASRGIGLAIARCFDAAGARHIVRVARSFPERVSERCTDLPCDVTREQDVAAACERILGEHGVPDLVVNNAGAFLLKRVHETSAAEFLEQLSANLVGAFLVIRAFLPHLLRRNAGHIVNIGSVADHEAHPGNAAYGASKYGLRGLHQAVHTELAGTAVRLSLVSPGPTDTSLWDPLRPDEHEDLPQREMMLRPEDVAEAVLFTVTRPAHVNVDWMWVNPVM